MAIRKSRIKCLLISSVEGMNILQPIIQEISNSVDTEIELYLNRQIKGGVVLHRQRDRDFASEILSSDIVFVYIEQSYNFSYFEVGVARAIGKPIVYITDSLYNELPDFIRQSYLITNDKKGNLEHLLKSFFIEFIESPKRFIPRPLIELDSSSQIVVDIEKLDPRDFENLCFELLSKLGYKQLEWKIKDDFIDAVSTLHRKDPDGFEYDEYWLIAFGNENRNKEMLEIAIHDPEYFAHRVFRNMFEPGMLDINRSIPYRSDLPVTILFILKENDKSLHKILKDLSRRDFRMNKKGFPFSVRIRWWDEAIITTLIQNNLSLARKYFSPDSFAKSGSRLSYEELYSQYAEMNEALQKTNLLLVSERNKIELLERDAAWKLLSFIAAHRLGNPIDAIDSELTNLKIAINMGKVDMVDEIVKSMEIPVERAKSIVSEFRNLSIAQEINPEEINSVKLKEMLNYSAKQALEKKVSVKIEINLKVIPNISIDVQKLSDCFAELIRNSLHHIGSDGGQVNICVIVAKKNELPDKIDKQNTYIKITFSDNGCGIPIDKKQDIFKPFERSYVHGTGLGLASCESIIETHGGKIRENGKFNEGANFEIFLPIIKSKD